MSSPIEKEVGIRGIESSSEDKVQSHHVDGSDPVAAIPPKKKFEAPEFIRNMSPEERLSVETSLRKKIDLRLMPMIVIMYELCPDSAYESRMLLLISHSPLGT